MHIPIVTPKHMAAADARTIAAGTAGDTLMERAGRACYREAVRLGGGIAGRRYVVVAGPGNNGGDGFVVARLLRRAGAWVRCIFVGDIDEVKADAATNLGRMRACGVAPRPFAGELLGADVVVDALFGTGFRGELHGDAAAAVYAIAASDAAVLAVDIPSGVGGSTGDVEGAAIAADVTVTMQAAKPGLVLEPGAQHVGTLVTEDIGIEIGAKADAELADRVHAASLLPERDPDTHKWAVGSVLAIGGSVGMSGAPTMVSLAGFHAGAGLVVCATPAPVQPLVAERILEVMTIPVPAHDGRLGSDALDAIAGLGRFSVVALGPGVGRGETLTDLVRKALVEIEQPLVLDADGLNAIHGDDLEGRDAPTIITPHDGEFERLGGDLDVGANRIEAAQSAAHRWGVTLLLKGPATIVATPGRVPTLCRGGGPELATAGSGDTLTGTIAAYAARGLDLHDAAVAAACVHGEAGRIAADSGRWITAGDVSAQLGIAEHRLKAGSAAR